MAGETQILERRFVPKNTLVMRQGESGNNAYLIQSGRVSIFTSHEDKIVELAKLGPGEIFGEMALIFDDPRSASVKTLEDSSLIAITRPLFKKKLRGSDPTIQAIVKMLTQRIVTANNETIRKKTDMADLKSTTRIIYQNIHSSLPQNQKRTFQSAVFPQLEEFMNAIAAFSERFGEQSGKQSDEKS